MIAQVIFAMIMYFRTSTITIAMYGLSQVFLLQIPYIEMYYHIDPEKLFDDA